MYKCSNKTCLKVRVIEYPESRKAYLGYGRYETRYFRVETSGRKIEMGYESTCECGKQCKSDRIKGAVSGHVCDIRCTSATGHNCECQCGGKNHGKDHQVAA